MHHIPNDWKLSQNHTEPFRFVLPLIVPEQTWGNYQLVNYFLPISHYNWQLKVICPFNEYISFNSTSFDQLVCQLLLILLLLIYSNSNLMGLINYFLLDLIFLLLALYLQSGAKILEAGKFLFSF